MAGGGKEGCNRGQQQDPSQQTGQPNVVAVISASSKQKPAKRASPARSGETSVVASQFVMTGEGSVFATQQITNERPKSKKISITHYQPTPVEQRQQEHWTRVPDDAPFVDITNAEPKYTWERQLMEKQCSPGASVIPPFQAVTKQPQPMNQQYLNEFSYATASQLSPQTTYVTTNVLAQHGATYLSASQGTSQQSVPFQQSAPIIPQPSTSASRNPPPTILSYCTLSDRPISSLAPSQQQQSGSDTTTVQVLPTSKQQGTQGHDLIPYQHTGQQPQHPTGTSMVATQPTNASLNTSQAVALQQEAFVDPAQTQQQLQYSAGASVETSLQVTTQTTISGLDATQQPPTEAAMNTTWTGAEQQGCYDENEILEGTSVAFSPPTTALGICPPQQQGRIASPGASSLGKRNKGTSNPARARLPQKRCLTDPRSDDTKRQHTVPEASDAGLQATLTASADANHSQSVFRGESGGQFLPPPASSTHEQWQQHGDFVNLYQQTLPSSATYQQQQEGYANTYQQAMPPLASSTYEQQQEGYASTCQQTMAPPASSTYEQQQAGYAYTYQQAMPPIASSTLEQQQEGYASTCQQTMEPPASSTYLEQLCQGGLTNPQPQTGQPQQQTNVAMDTTQQQEEEFDIIASALEVAYQEPVSETPVQQQQPSAAQPPQVPMRAPQVFSQDQYYSPGPNQVNDQQQQQQQLYNVAPPVQDTNPTAAVPCQQQQYSMETSVTMPIQATTTQPSIPDQNTAQQQALGQQWSSQATGVTASALAQQGTTYLSASDGTLQQYSSGQPVTFPQAAQTWGQQQGTANPFSAASSSSSRSSRRSSSRRGRGRGTSSLSRAFQEQLRRTSAKLLSNAPEGDTAVPAVYTPNASLNPLFENLPSTSQAPGQPGSGEAGKTYVVTDTIDCQPRQVTVLKTRGRWPGNEENRELLVRLMCCLVSKESGRLGLYVKSMRCTPTGEISSSNEKRDIIIVEYDDEMKPLPNTHVYTYEEEEFTIYFHPKVKELTEKNPAFQEEFLQFVKRQLLHVAWNTPEKL